MKALVLRAHGGNDRLHLETDFPDPEPGEGDVVVRVRACSLNYHDVFTRRGMPGIRIAMPAIQGLDVAGEIAKIGPCVTGWSEGDRVLVDPINRVEGGLVGETVHGGLAEFCRVRAHQLIRLPDGVPFPEAAALPCAWGTALRMMATNGGVTTGEKVLILGASGGVGVCCVQLARLVGAEVIACAGTDEKAARLKALGADHTINYVKEDFVGAIHARYGKPTRRGAGTDRGVDVVVNYTGGDTWVKSLRVLRVGADHTINYVKEDFVGAIHTRYGKPTRRGAGIDRGVDVVVNYTGGDTWVKSLRVLRVGGRLLTCGATAGFDPTEDIRFIWTFELKILGSNGWAREDILTLLDMVEARRLNALVETTLPLDEAAEGIRRLEAREVFGKIVVTP